jgi:carboxyl-terminal processing protease
MRRRSRRQLPRGVLLALLPVLLVVGIFLGGHPSLLPGFARSALVGDDEARLYDEAMGVIQDDYYRKVDQRQLVNSSIEGAVRSLGDQFSNYFSPVQYAHFQDVTSGEFEGIGVAIAADRRRRGALVRQVFAQSPAAAAGLRPGDVIVSVNGRRLGADAVTRATSLIRGRPGTTVRLTVLRGGRTSVREVRRARISSSVESEILRSGGRKIGYVRLTAFTSGVHAEVQSAVRRLMRQGADGLVLDLRDNGGGLLNEAVLISSIFIPDGTIVTTRGRARPEHRYTATGGAIADHLPLAVLVNENSASASEIVTGALRDRHRAVVVGQRTYGKGVFQEVRQLSNGGALDITVGEYFTPDGENLGGGGVKRGGGITPQVRALDDPRTRSTDEALRKAASVIAARL